METIEAIDLQWVRETAHRLRINGWRVIPWFTDLNTTPPELKPCPYAKNQRYHPNNKRWSFHPVPDVFSVALDGAILVDIDRNKPGYLGDAAVETVLGIDGQPFKLGTPHQLRESDGSAHYLFRLPEGVDPATLKHSADGQLLPRVDVKRGNQLIHIKRDKIMPHGGVLPRLEELPEAPPVLIELLRDKKPQRSEHAPLNLTDKTTNYGAAALRAVANELANAPDGERNSTLFKKAAKIGELIAGGEIAEHDAEAALENAAAATGLSESEIAATMQKGLKKGMENARGRAPAVASPDDFDAYTTAASAPPAAPVVRDVPEELANGPAFLYPGKRPVPFEQWNGLIGDTVRDTQREEFAAKAGNIRYVPPRVHPKVNKDGMITGFTPMKHSENLKWLLYRAGVRLARNLMSWEVEALDLQTYQPRTHEEEKTFSLLYDKAAEYHLPKEAIDLHVGACALDYSYHPIARLLAGRQWDGVQRVQRVFDCVPVAPEDEKLKNALLKGVCVAAIAAIDEGQVSMKYAPVLYSAENDFFKTSFIGRVYDITPGAFKAGVSVDPTKKDSVRPAIFCWCAELGELDGMTKKEAAPLKAWIGLNQDEWRPEHGKHYVRKKRQTVYIGTVNESDFLKNATLSSRFPVIRLKAPIEIDKVNQILGWELQDGQPVRTDPEQLLQFWLEVRAMRKAGASHLLDAETLAAMKESNQQHIDKGSYYGAILDLLNSEAGTGGEWEGTAFARGQRFKSSEMANALRVPVSQAGYVGRALKKLVEEGVLIAIKGKGTVFYAMKEPHILPDDDLSVEN